MQVGSLGWEDPLEEGMVNHSNILAWEIPWTEEPGYSPWSCRGLDTTEHTHTNLCFSHIPTTGNHFSTHYFYIVVVVVVFSISTCM